MQQMRQDLVAGYDKPLKKKKRYIYVKGVRKNWKVIMDDAEARCHTREIRESSRIPAG